MNELKRIGIFTKVVEAQSFSEAARQLGIAKSAVSKHVAELEKEVGIRLLNRSTRSLSLTEAGDNFYHHCQEIMQRTHIAFNELRQYQNQPTGTLRIASPINFGNEHLVPIIKEIRSLYPLLNIELLLEDRIINMVEEGVDVAIRIGWMKDSNLIAKKLGESPMLVFASPEYLAQSPQPKSPKDLQQHSWISLTILNSPLRWQFEKDHLQHNVQLNSTLKTNSVDAVVALVKNGQGISALAQYIIEKELRNGQLQTVLDDYHLKPVGIYAVYSHREHMQPKIRILIEFLSKYCQSANWTR